MAMVSQSAGSSLLEASGLVKSLGRKKVVDGVDLAVDGGEVLGLLGANGAGKTTTLRLLAGMLVADEGEIRFAGRDVRQGLQELKRRLGVCTQADTYDGDFTVADNLRIACAYYRPRPERPGERIEELLVRFGLDEHRDKKPDQLSGGFKRRLMIARALVHRPRLLFLDEPTTGLDPHARIGLWQTIAALRRDGLAIILTTHYMDEAERLSDRLVVLSDGRVVATGTPTSVLGDLLGEHVVVVSGAEAGRRLAAWAGGAGLPAPQAVLDEWHLAVRARDLAGLEEAAPGLAFELRPPSLDDLFLALSRAS